MTTLNQFLLARYPGDSNNRIKIREFVQCLCKRHMELGLADQNFESNLCSGGEPQYWQRVSEALLAHELLDAGLDVKSSRDGPDFLVMHEGRKIWVEVICPEPTGVPENWLNDEPNCVVTFPHETILLRWTAAIKEKAEKLLGNPEKKILGYLEKGVVAADDSYVIAVNGRMLRGAFNALTGISQLPFAVEAVFAVGPYQVNIDRTSLKATGSGHQHRPIISKPIGKPVPAYTFLDPAFQAVSAIWATDISDCWVIGNAKRMSVVHNPIATKPIPEQLLPADSEYVASACGEDEYLLEKINDRARFST